MDNKYTCFLVSLMAEDDDFNKWTKFEYIYVGSEESLKQYVKDFGYRYYTDDVRVFRKEHIEYKKLSVSKVLPQMPKCRDEWVNIGQKDGLDVYLEPYYRYYDSEEE